MIIWVMWLWRKFLESWHILLQFCLLPQGFATVEGQEQSRTVTITTRQLWPDEGALTQCMAGKLKFNLVSVKNGRRKWVWECTASKPAGLFRVRLIFTNNNRENDSNFIILSGLKTPPHILKIIRNLPKSAWLWRVDVGLGGEAGLSNAQEPTGSWYNSFPCGPLSRAVSSCMHTTSVGFPWACIQFSE